MRLAITTLAPSTLLASWTTGVLTRTELPLTAVAAACFTTSSAPLSPFVHRSCCAKESGTQPIEKLRLPISTRSMGSDASRPDGTQFPKGKSEDEWRTVLSPAQFKVLRQQSTEPAFTHEYENNTKQGVYTCAGCDTPLYKSATKFKSGCGWPAFFDAIPGAVNRKVDRTFGMKRIEIRCAACDSHLGHVFEGEGFPTPTDERHCVNGISLRFNEGEEKDGKM